MKLVINRCYGGYGISREAVEWLRSHMVEGAHKEVLNIDEAMGAGWFVDRSPTPSEGIWLNCRNSFSIGYVSRSDPMLVLCVETLGDKANGELSSLEIVEIPDGIEYYIHEYDGMESVHEAHRSWR